MMIKVITLLSIIDDTYDAYGTIDELELFTKAVERWDISSLDELPDYMKPIYRSFLTIYEEIEKEMRKEGRIYTLDYYKIEFKKSVQAFMTEARWLNENHIPTTEEYMRISKKSGAYPLLILTSYIGMGDIATKEIFNWVSNEPRIVNAAATLCRLMDEIVSSERSCYSRMQNRMTIVWKDINEECLRPTEVPMPFMTRVLNLSRFMDVIYKNKDNYTDSDGLMKTCIKEVLVDPVPI
ncbi:putative lyase [Medicago truncatula]|uniref:Putative lyase n=1 Tax=Medicago truncatula TaxID=3880 RepID=A0A396GXW2_MEDTR|nr:putative lyase [Medicago truncatula]